MFNKFSVIITAGGTSSRYGNTNKLLEKIKDKTVIEETVSKFVDFENIDEIIISANNSIMDILEDMFSNPKIRIIEVEIPARNQFTMLCRLLIMNMCLFMTELVRLSEKTLLLMY